MWCYHRLFHRDEAEGQWDGGGSTGKYGGNSKEDSQYFESAWGGDREQQECGSGRQTDKGYCGNLFHDESDCP